MVEVRERRKNEEKIMRSMMVSERGGGECEVKRRKRGDRRGEEKKGWGSSSGWEEGLEKKNEEKGGRGVGTRERGRGLVTC